MNDLDLSIIIVFHNEINEIKEVIDCLEKQEFTKFEIIVIDNNSTKENQLLLEEYMKNYPGTNVRYIKSKYNLFYAGGNNKGLKLANGRYVCLLNPDVWFGPDFLGSAMEFFKSPFYPDIFAPKMNFFSAKNRIWYAGAKIKPISYYFSKHLGFFEIDHSQYDKIFQTDYANGACLFIKRDVLEKIGFLDDILFIYVEEVDLNVRAKNAGFKILYNGTIKIYHKVKLVTQETRLGNRDSLYQMYLYNRNKIIFTWKNYSMSTVIGFYATYNLYNLIINFLLNLFLRKIHLIIVHLRAILMGTIIGIKRRTHRSCKRMILKEYRYLGLR